MPAKINLLPTELETGKEAGKIVKTLNNASLAVFALLVIFGLLALATAFFFGSELSKISQENESLKTNIGALQDAEEDLVLVKDRVQKIQSLLQSRENEEAFAKQKDVVNTLPEGVAFKETLVEGGQGELQVLATSSIGLSQMLKSLDGNNKFLYLALNRITFNPFLGYTASLDMF